LDDGTVVATPIVEVKNLNSFNAVRGAIEFELREQPGRWLADGRTIGPGTKQTRGFDDAESCTVLQREKEDAHDYRYFPDPDLLPVTIAPDWLDEVRSRLPELPLARLRRYRAEHGLSEKEAAALVEERPDSDYFEQAVQAAGAAGVASGQAGKAVANVLLQSGARRANARAQAGGSALISALGLSAKQAGGLVALRDAGAINNQAVESLFDALSADPSADPRRVAESLGLLVVRDDAAIDGWCQKAVAENAQSAADVRGGKDAALGRLVGAAMKHAAGKGDAQTIRARLLAMLGRV
ncbi:MAG: hypothetical protein ACT4PL_12160, partial [Phycisphaerales bacterium]